MTRHTDDPKPADELLQRINDLRSEITELRTQLGLKESRLAALLEALEFIPGHEGGADAEHAPAGQQRRQIRREFKVAAYRATRKAAEAKALSDHRRRVLDAVIEEPGVRAREIINATGLPHGSVQQALSWLRDHDLVTAEEDTTLDGTVRR